MLGKYGTIDASLPSWEMVIEMGSLSLGMGNQMNPNERVQGYYPSLSNICQCTALEMYAVMYASLSTHIMLDLIGKFTNLSWWLTLVISHFAYPATCTFFDGIERAF